MNRKTLLIFSSKKNKINEIKKFLPKKKYYFKNIKSLKESAAPKETGKSFAENAKIKSKFGYKIYGIPCIADDSGISIRALSGKPGIYSNRFQKENGGYKKSFKKIILATKKKNNNFAYFTCVISLTYDKNKTVTFTGKKNGVITDLPLGKRGFGYDPIFKPEKSKKTYGQMIKKEKMKNSHRSIALKKLNTFLKRIN